MQCDGASPPEPLASARETLCEGCAPPPSSPSSMRARPSPCSHTCRITPFAPAEGGTDRRGTRAPTTVVGAPRCKRAPVRRARRRPVCGNIVSGRAAASPRVTEPVSRFTTKVCHADAKTRHSARGRSVRGRHCQMAAGSAPRVCARESAVPSPTLARCAAPRPACAERRGCRAPFPAFGAGEAEAFDSTRQRGQPLVFTLGEGMRKPGACAPSASLAPRRTHIGRVSERLCSA